MKKKIYLGLPVLLLVFSSLACEKFIPSSSQPSLSGNIVYQSDQDGNFELYLMDLHNREPVRLTNNSANDVDPAFISFTNQIGFVSDRQDVRNLYIMDISGENTSAVTDYEDINIDYPDWSADGKFIAVSLVEECMPPAEVCYYDIYVMNADGTDFENLTNTPESEWVPVWSPDGQRIAFSSDRDGDSEIFLMNKDGSDLVQLTENDGHDGRPRWSPDGSEIAFETDRDGDDWDIYIMNADGSDPRPVTSNTTSDFAPAWSPDGNWLVYVSNNDEDNEIFIIDINGQNQQRLTSNSYNDTSPVWIP